jgi:acetylornithine/N-succinyldiaminopimelate aminotransferase
MTTNEKSAQYILGTYGRFPLTLVKGAGTRVWDDAGKSYLDFCMGIATCSLGHAHPAHLAAIQEQANTLLHCSNLYQNPKAADLAEVIVEKHVQLPGKVFFSNSGAEANDGLLKLARRFGHATPNASGESRYEVITFNQSFHGRTIGAMSATAQAKVHEGYAPLLPGFRYLPFNDLSALKEGITPSTSAILLEPIQGEGGVHVATPEFLRGVAALCKEHNLLLLLDEVQCGFGRCGELMGWRSIAPELKPDGISWAKGLGGGFPIGAFWTSDRTITTADGSQSALSSLMGPGSHGSTYGGNPLACAAALAVLSEIHEQDLAGHAAEMGKLIQTTVSSWNHPAITGIRGGGLLLGLALDSTKFSPPEGQTPALELTLAALAAGLLVVPAGPETLRLLPPLNVTPAEITEALGILQTVLDTCTS